MVTPFFVRNLARTLAPDGHVYAASDVKEWAEEIFAMLDAGGFRRIDLEPPGAKRSAFGRKYMAQGKPVYFASFEKACRLLRVPGACQHSPAESPMPRACAQRR